MNHPEILHRKESLNKQYSSKMSEALIKTSLHIPFQLSYYDSQLNNHKYLHNRQLLSVVFPITLIFFAALKTYMALVHVRTTRNKTRVWKKESEMQAYDLYQNVEEE